MAGCSAFFSVEHALHQGVLYSRRRIALLAVRLSSSGSQTVTPELQIRARGRMVLLAEAVCVSLVCMQLSCSHARGALGHWHGTLLVACVGRSLLER